MSKSRRLRHPLVVYEVADSFYILDSGARELAHIDFESDPARRRTFGRLSKEEARAIAHMLVDAANGQCLSCVAENSLLLKSRPYFNQFPGASAPP